jgi:hypothetical protein
MSTVLRDKAIGDAICSLRSDIPAVMWLVCPTDPASITGYAKLGPRPPGEENGPVLITLLGSIPGEWNYWVAVVDGEHSGVQTHAVGAVRMAARKLQESHIDRNTLLRAIMPKEFEAAVMTRKANLESEAAARAPKHNPADAFSFRTGNWDGPSSVPNINRVVEVVHRSSLKVAADITWRWVYDSDAFIPWFNRRDMLMQEVAAYQRDFLCDVKADFDMREARNEVANILAVRARLKGFGIREY